MLAIFPFLILIIGVAAAIFNYFRILRSDPDKEAAELVELEPIQRISRVSSVLATVATASIILVFSIASYFAPQPPPPAGPVTLTQAQYDHLISTLDKAQRIFKDSDTNLEGLQDAVFQMNSAVSGLEKSELPTTAPKEFAATQAGAERINQYFNSLKVSVAQGNDVVEQLRSAVARPSQLMENFSLVSPAFAASPDSDVFSSQIPLKLYLMGVVVLSLTLLLVACLYLLVFSKDKEKVKFADGMTRNIAGFYIGMATGILGLR